MNEAIIRVYTLTDSQLAMFRSAKDAKDEAERMYQDELTMFNNIWSSLAPKVPKGERLVSVRLVRDDSNRVQVMTESVVES